MRFSFNAYSNLTGLLSTRLNGIFGTVLTFDQLLWYTTANDALFLIVDLADYVFFK